MAKIKEETENLKLNCDIDKNADNSVQSHMEKGQNELHKWCPICGHISTSDNHLKRHVKSAHPIYYNMLLCKK